MKHTSGFSLIELLIVITIVGTLAAVLTPNLLTARAASHNTAAKLYGQKLVVFTGAWLLADRSRRTSDLDTTCTAATYVTEGAPAALPAPVKSCQITPTAGGYIVEVESSTGEIFRFEQ